MFHLRVVPCIQNFKIFPKLGPRFQIKKSPKHPVARGIYCPIIRTRGGGVRKKSVPLEYFWEENLYLRNFPDFWAKMKHFLNFSKNYSLKMH